MLPYKLRSSAVRPARPQRILMASGDRGVFRQSDR
jgi:hypothetical protein